MNTEQTMIRMVLDRWFGILKNFNTALDALPDEQLMREISPGKNRGIYLLGHLTAVHDDMMRLLDFGDKQYPELVVPFLESPDKAVADIPSAATVRAAWHKTNDALAAKFSTLTAEDWFSRHTAVPAVEFAAEPHRNKLNIIITRTSHLSYHTGQFVLLR
jgi:hypothetical protein